MQEDPIMTHFKLSGTIKLKILLDPQSRRNTNSYYNNCAYFKVFLKTAQWTRKKSLNPKIQVEGPKTFTNEEIEPKEPKDLKDQVNYENYRPKTYRIVSETKPSQASEREPK